MAPRAASVVCVAPRPRPSTVVAASATAISKNKKKSLTEGNNKTNNKKEKVDV